MVVKWNGMQGIIKNKTHEASMELLTEDREEPEWFCLFSKYTGDWSIREFFEVGKLEQAYNWCVNQLIENEGSKEGRNSED